MPVTRCRRDGKPGFRWGKEGKCYVYPTGNESAKKRARTLAEKQGRAIEASKRRS